MVGLNGSAPPAKVPTVRRFRRRSGLAAGTEVIEDDLPPAVVGVEFSDADRELLHELVQSQNNLAAAHERLVDTFEKEREARRRDDERRESELADMRARATVSAEEIDGLKADKVNVQAIMGVVALIGVGIGTVATIFVQVIFDAVVKKMMNG